MPPLLIQGLELMLFGMGTVVLFLGLLVLATRLMSQGIQRLESGRDTRSERKLHTSVVPMTPLKTTVTDPRLAVAAVAAVQLHREKRA